MSRSRPRRAGGQPRHAAEARPAWLTLNAPVGVAAPRWSGPAAWSVIAAFGVTLAWVAFALHTVGDYLTESDFYGGYFLGARLFLQGHVDPSRYAVVGPVYELTLALAGLVVRDLFTAARLVSVAAAVATLVLWRAILARRAGTVHALWAVAFVAANPVFFRYGYSASTDMLAIAFQAAALHAALVERGRWAPFRAGLWAAIATLTRYNSVYLVPAAVLAYAALAPAPGMTRRRAVVLCLAGFTLLAAPWFGWSLAKGYLPGAELFSRFGSFYTVKTFSRNVQDVVVPGIDSLDAARQAAAPHGGGALALLRNVPDHLVRDGMELLGPPVLVLALIGLVFACLDGAWRGLMPVWASGALLFATLIPVFYSDRYSMALLPAYASMAAQSMASVWMAFRLRVGFTLKWLVGGAVLAYSILISAAYQQNVIVNQPVEVVAAGRALAAAARPGERVLSRKGHIGYYSGCAVTAMPRFGRLADLGAYARSRGVRFLYFSWYEAGNRPELAYLIDTTSAVPGLTVLHFTEHNPGVLYRIGPEFGREPAWAGDSTQRAVHFARAAILFQPNGPLAPSSHLVLAEDAFARRDAAATFEHLEQATGGATLDPEQWNTVGRLLNELGRPQDAARAYQEAARARRGAGEAESNR